jgi:nitrate/nitrite-specific signal transduction histidine kinase
MLEQLKSIEGENQHFAKRYVEVEDENNNLANLYVATYQLHSTLDSNEVVKVILEIVINLIGAEIFCVYVCEEGSEVLTPAAAEGDVVADCPTLRVRRRFRRPKRCVRQSRDWKSGRGGTSSQRGRTTCRIDSVARR